MIRVVSASHYFQPVADDALPSLADSLRDLCRENIRRIDRFIQLALLGSARCASGQTLQPDCGIYLGSGIGPIGNNIETQRQLIQRGDTPKPVNFINTLGASAGFYAARNLGLAGQNLFISRRGASFEAALGAAIADLAVGAAPQALVGVVEEVALPLNDHRQRQNLAADAPLAEGSHWLLLERAGATDSQIDFGRYPDREALEDALRSGWRDGDSLLCGASMAPDAAATFQNEFPAAEPVIGGAFHDSISGARVTGFIVSQRPGQLFLADGSTAAGWQLFRCRAQLPED
ncbi:MAG TPA: hypothetical protein VFK45_05955 [Gammaproteobacteria bacterium]|nr:hypothetical protein [Gammaproteobacteria bacterium]